MSGEDANVPKATNGAEWLLIDADDDGDFKYTLGGGSANILDSNGPIRVKRRSGSNQDECEKAAVKKASLEKRDELFESLNTSRKRPRQVPRTSVRDVPVEYTCLCVEGVYNASCPVCDPPRDHGTRESVTSQRRNQTMDSLALSGLESSKTRATLLNLTKSIRSEQRDYEATQPTSNDHLDSLNRVIDLWHKADTSADPSKACPGPASLPLKLSKILKPHQIAGLRFLWSNIVVMERRWEGPDPVLGCVLAHSMGLGKTAQTVIFASLLVGLKMVKTILVLAPKSTMSNWASEIERWSQEAGHPLKQFSLPDNCGIRQRVDIISDWHTKGGVLVMGYEQYGGLTGAYSSRNTQLPKHMTAKLLECLRDPGPDIVICDEGHIMRNSNASISKALVSIKTNKRLILTGTPLQNHLSEYWTMIDFIRPGHFPKKEFIRFFEHPMVMGQKNDAESHHIELMRKRAFILQQELTPFVHRKDQTILQKDLPKKEEFVVFCPLSNIQREAFTWFRTAYQECPGDFHTGLKKNMLYFISIVNKLGGHPDLLRNFIKEKNKDQDLGVEVTYGQVWEGSSLMRQSRSVGKIMDSPKLLCLLIIVEYCVKNKQKLLVFSQFVQTLEYLETQISKLTKGRNMWRLDGSSSGSSRAESIKNFQEHTSWGVFLISTRAGGVGINLCSAHKAVLFDVSFNPALDQQAIFRCYRYGLKHPVTIYRLVSDNTPEAHIFSSCVSKEWMAKKVVDSSIPSRENVRGSGLSGVYDDTLLLGQEESAWATDHLKMETSHCLSVSPLMNHVNNKLLQSKQPPLRRVMRHESLLLDDDAEKAGEMESQAYNDYIEAGGLYSSAVDDGGSSFGLITGCSHFDLPDYSCNDDWSVTDEAKKPKEDPMKYIKNLVSSNGRTRNLEIRSSQFGGTQKLL
eukprot:TRINITY_DN13325_c0_g1_i1.p1 TRINITY_DN13325_c0_g1~~TRINITY_DN13325_c0_g1_i1.p1  ORF type:complete len:913 (+),score=173.95 TRINITY_DN13325_c0_g1_i1:95-2833(+)